MDQAYDLHVRLGQIGVSGVRFEPQRATTPCRRVRVHADRVENLRRDPAWILSEMSTGMALVAASVMNADSGVPSPSTISMTVVPLPLRP